MINDVSRICTLLWDLCRLLEGQDLRSVRNIRVELWTRKEKTWGRKLKLWRRRETLKPGYDWSDYLLLLLWWTEELPLLQVLIDLKVTTVITVIFGVIIIRCRKMIVIISSIVTIRPRHFPTSCSKWLEPPGFLISWIFWTILPFELGLYLV